MIIEKTSQMVNKSRRDDIIMSPLQGFYIFAFKSFYNHHTLSGLLKSRRDDMIIAKTNQ